ncbi:MAG: glycosyltransferase family 39 protein [Candidatus Omnitrophica bacterium]|nr:glycosyltransferase family 39 protein [Candidatus Omnitrophota bacterium]
MNSTLRNLVILILCVKLIQLAVPAVAFHVFPFQNEEIYRSDNIVYPENEPVTWKTAYKTWDANHYLYLAEKGYLPRGISNRFPPLYPLLIWLAKGVAANSALIGGLIVSNIASLFAFLLLYKLARTVYGEAAGLHAVKYAIFFPTSFFFSRAYSESLFFLLAVCCFYCLTERKYVSGGICAGLLTLTRTVGCLILVPLSVCLFFERDNKRAGSLIFFPILAILMQCAFFQVFTGNAFELFMPHCMSTSAHSVKTVLHPVQWFLENFVNINYSWYGATNNVFDRIAFFLFILFFYRILRAQGAILFAYSFTMGFVPAMTDHFMSYTRLLIVVFPLFIQLALGKFHHSLILTLMLICQIFLLACHSLGFWVA